MLEADEPAQPTAAVMFAAQKKIKDARRVYLIAAKV
jgi:hypothetical protein